MRSPSSTSNAPNREVPRELTNAWLRLHEAKWCRGLDTVFVFDSEGMEVWCRVENEKNYQRFSAIMDSLKRSYPVELYATFPTQEQERIDKDPPPSLWNNLELRAYLRDPSLLVGVRRDTTMRTRDIIAGRRDFFLKQRMVLFAAETLEWTRNMRRYGSCLPSVTEVAFDPARPVGVRDRARAICAEHAREIDKFAGKIVDNLARAMPKLPNRSGDQKEEREKSVEPSAREAADQICANTQSVGQSIYRFFYPRRHSVRLVDLKYPRTIDSIRALRTMARDYMKLISKQPQRE